MYLELSFDLGSVDPQAAEGACWACGASALTFVDARDDAVNHPTKSGPTCEANSSPLDKTPYLVGTPVLEPAPGEFRLWPRTRLRCLFGRESDVPGIARALAAALGLDPESIEVRAVADRVWEREWLKHFHSMRFGRRLWVCPHHERVSAPEAIVVALDPGLAFGTGTHPSTALCLTWLDAHAHLLRAPAEHSVDRQALGLDAHAHLLRAPAEHSVDRQALGLDAHLAPGARVIDYGCGSGVLALAAAKLGAAEVHCFDIDPQALSAARANSEANGLAARVQVHEHADALPQAADLLLANILSGPLSHLAPPFASLVRPGGQVVLAGLMQHEVADVTGAYAPCFDVAPFGEREGWVGLAGRRL
jgi:ribosomal protein L11 methyltransferase